MAKGTIVRNEKNLFFIFFFLCFLRFLQNTVLKILWILYNNVDTPFNAALGHDSSIFGHPADLVNSSRFADWKVVVSLPCLKSRDRTKAG